MESEINIKWKNKVYIEYLWNWVEGNHEDLGNSECSDVKKDMNERLDNERFLELAKCYFKAALSQIEDPNTEK